MEKSSDDAESEDMGRVCRVRGVAIRGVQAFDLHIDWAARTDLR